MIAYVEQDAVVDTGLGHRRLGLLHPWEHPRQRAEPAHLLHRAQLPAQVVHIELALGHPRRHTLGIGLVDRRRSTLDDRDDIAHAEDAPGNAAGIERLERVELFADAGKLDRLARDRAHRQRRAAASIAVHPRQDHAGQIDLAREALRDVDRVLSGERIDHQQHFARGGDRRDGAHFVHQRLVDMEPPRGIEQQHVDGLELGRLHRAGRDIDRRLARDDRQRRNPDLFTQHGELFLRGRAVDVQRRHQRLLAVLFANQLGQLGGRRGLARALQPDHEDHYRGRRGEIEPDRFLAAEHRDERVVDDLDDLLARGDRTQHRLADRGLGHLVDEPAHHGQRDIGLEQRDADLAHGFAHVRLVERAAPAQPVEDPAEAVGQTVEHRYHLPSGDLAAATKREKSRWAKPRRPA